MLKQALSAIREQNPSGFKEAIVGGSITNGEVRGAVITFMLVLILLASAVGVIYVSHQSRLLYAEQGKLQVQQDELQLEFAQLLLEQSAWSSPNRVEAAASNKLQMVMPEADQIEMIK